MVGKFNLKRWFEEREAHLERLRAEKKLLLGHASTFKRKKIFRRARKNSGIVFQMPSFFRYEPEPDNPSPFYSGRAFAKKLEAKGFERLGGGMYSTVLGRTGSDKVIKVIRNPTDGWIDYIRWASKHGFAGTLAPRVYSYKFIKGKKHSFALAVMERLDQTLRDVPHKHDLAFMNGLFEYAARHDNDNAKKLIDITVPGMANFATSLGQAFRNGLDLHSGNFMLRQNGSLVVSDPVCARGHVRSKSTTERLKAKDFLAA